MMEQKGSATATALAGLLSVSLVALYLFDHQQKAAQSLQESRLVDRGFLGNAINESNFSQLKALFADTLVAGGGYESGIYAQDYFSPNWNLATNSQVSGVAVQNNKVTVNFVKPAGIDIKEAEQAITSGTVASQLTVPYEINIIAFNRNALHPAWIESLDVKASAAGNLSSTARIPINAPKPQALAVQVRGPGQANFTQNFGTAGTPLPAGDYTFQVIGSGVVHYAELNIAGQTHILGIQANTGAITHNARNVKAQNQIIGEVTLTLAGSGSQTGTNVSVDTQTCHVVTSPIMAGGGSQSFSLQASAYAVDGSEAVSLRQTKDIFIAGSGGSNQSGGAGQLACGEKCLATNLWIDLGNYTYKINAPIWAPMLDAGITKTGNEADRFQQAPIYTGQMHTTGVSGVICQNHDLLAFEIQKQYQMMPSALLQTQGDAAMVKSILDNMTLREDYAFLPPSCQKQFVGARSACGCFAENTLILMADDRLQAIRDIRAGDEVRNPLTSQIQVVKRVIAGPEHKPMFAIRTAGGEVLVTEEHPFPTQRGLVAAMHLTEEDRIQGTQQWQDVLKIERRQYAVPPIVWNIELEGSVDVDHYLLADGVVTGDLFLQERLAKSKGESR